MCLSRAYGAEICDQESKMSFATCLPLTDIELAKKQHPRARRGTSDSGGARDPASDRSNFLQKDKQRDQRDPKHVHYPAHKQKRHQNPAAADTITSVLKAQQQT